MSGTMRAHGLLVMSSRLALVLVKSVLIVLMLHLLASHFDLRLFREAGGSVSRTGPQPEAARFAARRA